MVKHNNNIEIKPISCELSDNMKKIIEWQEWTNKVLEAYTLFLFHIPKEHHGKERN